ncbi:HAD family phosphatase [Myxococcota bacterium]|nr:HAD family phosphatase [Myxococcota bacterium]
MEGGIEAVAFDLGQVLVRVHLDAGLWPALIQAGGGDPSDISRLRENDLLVAFDCGHLDPLQFHQAFQDRTGIRMGFVEFASRWCDVFSPMPGMEDLVEDLATAGIRLGGLSDTDPLHFPWCQRHFPAVRRIPAWVVSYEVGAMKPDPRLYRALVEALEVPPERILFVDDLERNVNGAREHGIQGFCFTGVERLRQHLEERGIRFVQRGGRDSNPRPLA